MKRLLIILAFSAISASLFSQNVGIGTATPTDGRLHVVNAGNSTAAMFSDGTTGLAIINENTRPAIGLNMYYSGSDYKFKSAGYGGIFYYVPGEGRMTYYSSTAVGAAGGVVSFKGILTMQSGGNVGIGTTSPNTSRLEIEGPANFSQLISVPGNNLPGISHSVPLGFSPTLSFNMYYANAFRFMSPGYGANIQYSPSTGILYFTTSQTKGAVGDLAIFNANSVAIDSNGYLGIGTSAPKGRLHVTNNMVVGPVATTPAVGYLLSVDGKIICEELKVQISDSWPDYVFENDYHLPSLDDLQQKVMSDKHLPGIPSAADITASQGFAMGDMQKRLLEKVEELYRYMFVLNQENKSLKAEIQAIKAGDVRK